MDNNEHSTNLAEVGTDYISRQAAIDAMMRLQVEDIEMYGCAIPEGFDGDRAAEALKVLPSADIICCRDCKHVEHDELFHDFWCRGREVEPDHFCGYAERKEKTDEGDY